MGELILNKKYKLHSSDNFDEFMKALGVSFLIRKMGNAVSPVIELTEKDGEYTLTSNFILKSSAIIFKMGEEFDEETPDGRKVRTTMTQEGNKLIQIQKGDDKETKIVHEFTPETVTMTLYFNDLVAQRIFKAEP